MHTVSLPAAPQPARSRLASRAVLLVVAASAALAGCENLSTGQNTGVGAASGALAGAAIGAATGNKAGTGALVGAAIGAVAGNVWSRRMEEQRLAMERATQGTGMEVTRTENNELKLNVPSDVSFDTGRADIKPELRAVLDQFAQGLKSQPNTLVRVIGHTDSTGSDAINNPLSERRAESVRSYLVDRGVSGSRIETAGRGSREPVASNATADGKSKNRRVEIFLREPQQG
jgi:outer membrane protein OmpA-like peptidoglycan-associated protein